MEHRGIPGEPCGDSSSSWEFRGWLPLPRELAPFHLASRPEGELQFPLCLLISLLAGSA